MMDRKNAKRESAKLMTPLFDDMNFNRAGTRIRAKYVKTLHCDGTDYSLWVSAGKPENNYPRAENDTHYLMIQAGGYLVPCGYTEYGLEQESGYSCVVPELYESQEARQRFFDELRKGKSYEEANPLIVQQIAKENEFIMARGKEEAVQSRFLKIACIDPEIQCYIDARDKGGKFASFRGAAFLGEVEKCYEINLKYKEEEKKKDAIERAEREERERKEAEAKAAAELVEIEKAEEAILHGGTIKNPGLIIKIADKYGVDVPLRTRGWILNTLVEFRITKNGYLSYSYRGRKGSKGSQKIYEVIGEAKNAIQKAKAA